MPSPTRSRTAALRCAAVVITVLALAVACGRSSAPVSSASSKPATSTSASTGAAGSFGTLTKVCAPGPGTGGSGRGIVGKEIRVGTLADPGNTAVPGLEHEFFDVADAFAKWCNAAGGINGHQIVVDKLDAKLFNGAQEVIQACQQDFMLVGGGNGLDAPDVKPRLACKLGQIPAYTVSPEASSAGLQVSPNATSPTAYPVGALRLLANAYPASQQGLGVGASNLASLLSISKQTQEAYQKLGFKVTALQLRPAIIDNWRPWLEQLKTSGAKAEYELTQADPTPIFNGLNDTGFKPEFVLFSSEFYSAKSVQAANAVPSFPPSYVSLNHLPFELSAQYPVVRQIKSIMSASLAKPEYTDFTASAFDAWALWAQSATACGQDLTQACVLAKAATHASWDVGGFFAPRSTLPGNNKFPDCVLLMRLTTQAFGYDKTATKPNTGLYNCDPQNVVTVHSYQTS